MFFFRVCLWKVGKGVHSEKKQTDSILCPPYNASYQTKEKRKRQMTTSPPKWFLQGEDIMHLTCKLY